MVADLQDELEHWRALFVAALRHKTRGRMIAYAFLQSRRLSRVRGKKESTDHRHSQVLRSPTLAHGRLELSASDWCGWLGSPPGLSRLIGTFCPIAPWGHSSL